MLCDFYKWFDVKEMSAYAKENDLKLLSDFDGDFWSDYIENSSDYDRAFTRMYKSYRYYDQEPFSEESTISEVTNNFIDAVHDYLLMNEKRFSELYRIKVLDDEDISLLNDYNITEVMDRTKVYDGDYVYGQRSDSTSDTIGSRSDDVVNQKEGFNSSAFNDNSKRINTQGQQINSSSVTKGQQTDTDDHTEDDDYTLTKSGSVGNPYDNITKFQKVWTNFEFMQYIFRQICAELLLV